MEKLTTMSGFARLTGRRVGLVHHWVKEGLLQSIQVIDGANVIPLNEYNLSIPEKSHAEIRGMLKKIREEKK